MIRESRLSGAMKEIFTPYRGRVVLVEPVQPLPDARLLPVVRYSRRDLCLIGERRG